MQRTNLIGHRIRIAHVLAVALLAAACGGGGPGGPAPLPSPPPPPPFAYQPPADTGDLWLTAAASEGGMSETLLEEMMHAVQAGDYPLLDSIAVAHQGKLVFHETIRTTLNTFDDWVDNADLALHVQFSVSKSLASVLVGIAIDQGVFAGTEVPFLSLFDYPAYDNWDPRKNDITLGHVLKMRLGLEWNEWDPDYSNPDNQMFVFYDSHVDFAKGLLDLPISNEPGTSFAYNTVASVSLGQAIENRAPLSLVDFATANLLAPLGISQVEVFRTPTGLPDLGRGVYLTARDALKFGQLYLDSGRWNGQQIVSADWVAESLTPYTEMQWADPDAVEWQLDGYGYQWWLGHFDVDGRRIDTFAARGHGEQWIMAMPELALVVAINAHAWEGRREQMNQVLDAVTRFILPAVLSN
jgi:CubicO group peptidase (beta-lactamase class C family)